MGMTEREAAIVAGDRHIGQWLFNLFSHLRQDIRSCQKGTDMNYFRFRSIVQGIPHSGIIPHFPVCCPQTLKTCCTGYENIMTKTLSLTQISHGQTHSNLMIGHMGR